MRGHRRVTKLCLLMGGQWSQLLNCLWIHLEASRRGGVSRRDGNEEFPPNVMIYVEAPCGKCYGSGGDGSTRVSLHAYAKRNICVT